MEQMPEDLEFIGDMMSNYDHEIEPGTKIQLNKNLSQSNSSS